MDFAEQTGSSAAAGTTADASSGLGYVTVTPLPAGTLFTETQSQLDVTWTTYNVTVTINGTDFPVSFSAGDTKAVVIEKVPVGASLSASATIGVPENLGYPGNSLTAATAAPTTIQSGANTITMWVQYPLEFHVSTAHQTNASITGTQPAYYTNASATPLPETTATYTNVSTNKIMRFTGWAFENNGTPVITSTSIPPSIYKGKLSLYASYGECALHITGSGISAGTTPVIAADGSLALTAVAEGFPAGAAISYSWRVVPPASGTAPATVSGSGASATVYPVAGAGGSATVEVTATSGVLTASAMLNVDVQATLPDFTIQISPPSSYKSAKSDATAKKYALVNLTDAFTFTAVPAPGKSFPAGTTFSWTVKAGTMPEYTGTGISFTATPTQLSLTAESIGRTSAGATPITVTCTASHTLASAPKTAAPGSASAFLLQTIPAFKIDILPPSSHNAANSDSDSNTYALTSLTDSFSLSLSPAVLTGVVPVLSVPADTTFEWKFNGTVVPGVTGTLCTLTPAALGMTAASPGTAASPKSVVISCTAKSPNAAEDVDAAEETVKAFRLTIPAYKITVTPPTGLETDPDAPAGSPVYLVTNGDLTAATKKFNLKVEPVNSGDTIPTGTEFTWSFDAAASDTNPRDVTIGTMCGLTAPGATVPADTTEYTISCTASLTGAVTPASAPATATVKLKKKLSPVTMRIGSEIRTALKSLGAGTAGAGLSFAASAAPPAAGTTTSTLSEDGSEGTCLAWLDGTTIKYYAEGYTDVMNRLH